jgi:hypothetical protein
MPMRTIGARRQEEKKNARISKGDSLAEFPRKTITVKEAPGREEKPEVVRDSIEAAGSRLG